MPPRILVPFDDSEPARQALDHAFELFPDGEFVVLTVVDTTSLPFIPNAASEGGGDEETQELLGEAAARIEVAESIADEHGIEIETQARLGTPAQEVLEYAENRPVDHIVIGSHGRSGVARILLGSVAEVVVRHSPVPVTVVR
ncbi:universal stress protein [Natrinema salifodinae]|uniref:Nucleotide-binding universal stress protein, UspA family n=1 Tax=Natrinema salifodinae TaxID=1202768 RepID=A0A1I0MCK8_9EURY|nr:universal stress protein [Natrinema salifodinae]SEV86022.1 Nucleotide-binding universal stress protein, UspA family [Natrinema salifodinae]